MKFVYLTTDVFKMKECPKYTKYAFCCIDDGCLYFSNEHPEIVYTPGIELGWIPQNKSKYKKCKDIFVRSDYLERLVLCKNGTNFNTHDVDIARMRKMDIWRENDEITCS